MVVWFIGKDDEIGGSWFSGEGGVMRRARIFVNVLEKVFRIGVPS